MLDQLSQQGFSITPIEKIRVQQLLSAQPQLLLSAEGRQKLGTLLSPLLAKNAIQQRQFYQTYQRYLEDLVPKAKPPLHQKPSLSLWEKILPFVLGAMLLTAVGCLIYFLSQTHEQDHFHFKIKHKKEDRYLANNFNIKVDEELIFENQTDEKFRGDVDFHWQWLDTTSQKIEPSIAKSDDWNLIVPSPGQQNQKLVIMTTRKKDSEEEVDRDTAYATISCSNAPIIPSIDTDQEVRVGQEIQFSTPLTPQKNYTYSWDFGNGKTSSEVSPTHTFLESKKHIVKLTITNLEGDAPNCSTTASSEIDLNITLPELPSFALQKDILNRQWKWGWATILLLIGLVGSAIYNWWRWYRRPDENEIREQQAEAAFQKLWEIEDDTPYSIPFENKNPVIDVQVEQFSIAKALRQRQEGTRLEMDVPATIKSTVEGGGYPSLQFKYNTRPTDYLFLIDIQSGDSHQARLFQYLLELWEQQDVHFDVFYYKNDLSKIWHPKYPNSLSLEELHRILPDRRLIIFGDAYTLLHTSDEFPLHPVFAGVFRKWQERILVTPIPIASWTFREARLYQLFPIFHADLSGLIRAAQFIETGMSEEDLPSTLRKWEEELERTSTDVATDRDWDELESHQDYLRRHPDVLRWLMALTVHPNPTWNVTIAIGKGIGVPITYENLLLLSRIPWLQRGEMNSELWEEVLESNVLSKEDERKARQAVNTELEAIRKATAKGFAKRELETRLIVNNFALEPDKEEYQSAVRFLLGQEFVDPMLQQELDGVVERHIPYQQKGKNVGDVVRGFLEKETSVVERPTDNFHLRAAITWSVLSLISLFFVTIVNSDRLYEWIDGKVPAPEERATELRNYHFVKEVEDAPDEAVRLNNEGMDIFEKTTPPTEAEPLGISSRYYQMFQHISDESSNIAATKLAAALELRSNQYDLAKTNLAKLFHYEGVNQFQQYTSDTSYLSRARLNFQNAWRLWQELPEEFDSLRFHSLHGIALSEYFSGNENGTCNYLQQLIIESKGQFFSGFNKNKNPSLLSLAKNQCLAATDFTISIRWRGSRGQQMALNLQSTLRGLGYTVANLQNRDKENGINYFDKTDEEIANQIASVVNNILTRNNLIEKIGTLQANLLPSSSRKGQIEVFLNIPDETIDPAQTTYNIVGKVVDQDNQPLSGVLLEDAEKFIQAEDSPVLRGPFEDVVIDNQQGEFNMTFPFDIYGYGYEIIFSKEGYESQTLFVKNGRDSFNIIVQLIKKSNTDTTVDTTPGSGDDPNSRIIPDNPSSSINNCTTIVSNQRVSDGSSFTFDEYCSLSITRIGQTSVSINVRCDASAGSFTTLSSGGLFPYEVKYTDSITYKIYVEKIVEDQLSSADWTAFFRVEKCVTQQNDYAKKYRNWLKESGLSKYIFVNTFIGKSDEKIMYLEFPFSNTDSVTAFWTQLKTEFDSKNFRTLEGELFEQLALLFQGNRKELNIQIYDTYDVREEYCFKINIFWDGQRVRIEKETCKAGLREMNFGTFNLPINKIIDLRDGQEYAVITIVNQTWMAKNLNYTTPNSWCYLELPALCTKAGRLYTWEAAKSACPSGWHLPNDEEWKTLLNNYDGEGTTSYQALIDGGDSKFRSLLGGVRSSSGEYFYLGENGYYWIATESAANSAWYSYFNKVSGKVGRFSFDKTDALSCRCIKD